MKKDQSPLVSIIVPIYNVEKYLDMCLSEIVNQTYTNIQIILVDDGSTDNSLAIIQKWADTDARIQYIHQDNRGVGGARNTGTQAAEGEYICYIDPDDEIDERYCEILLGLCRVYDADIAVGGYDSNGIIHDNHVEKAAVISAEKAVDMMIDGIISTTIWPQMYRASLAKKHRFYENMAYEDMLYVYETMIDADRCAISNDTIYHYKSRKGSLSNTHDDHTLEDRLRSQEMTLSFMIEHYREADIRVLKKRLQNWCRIQNDILMNGADYTLQMLKRISTIQQDRRKLLAKYIKENRKTAYRLSRTDKIKLYLIVLTPRSYNLLFGIKHGNKTRK